MAVHNVGVHLEYVVALNVSAIALLMRDVALDRIDLRGNGAELNLVKNDVVYHRRLVLREHLLDRLCGLIQRLDTK